MKRTRVALSLVLALMIGLCPLAAFADGDAAQYLANGMTYLFGRSGDGYDQEAALASFEAAANSGSAEALYYIGQMFERSAATGRYQQAMAYYEQAAALGCPKGLLGKGVLYEKGLGVARDYAMARALFEQAVSLGCTGAYVGLGDLYRNGEGVEADGVAALNYYVAALSCGDYELVNAARVKIGIT